MHYRTGDTLCFCLPRSPAAPGSLCKACSPLIFVSMAATLISLNYDHQRATRAGSEDLLRPYVSSLLAKCPILGHRAQHRFDLPRAPRKATGPKTTFFFPSSPVEGDLWSSRAFPSQPTCRGRPWRGGKLLRHFIKAQPTKLFADKCYASTSPTFPIPLPSP